MEIGGKMAKIPMNLKEFGHLSEKIINGGGGGNKLKSCVKFRKIGV